MGFAYWDDLTGVTRNPRLLKAVDWLLTRQRPAGEVPYRDWLSCGVRTVEQGSMMTTVNSLVAFEATARHLSYKDAARELKVTPAALSRQIRTLEVELRQALFLRNGRGFAVFEGMVMA